MVDYLASIAVASCLVGILEYLSYSERTKSVVRLCASILLLHAVLTPVLGLCSSLKDGSFAPDFGIVGEEISGGEYEAVAEEAFCEGICKLLYTKFGVKSENALVRAEGFDFEKMRAERITVILSGAGALADQRAIREYISELGLGECEVIIRIG